MAKSDARFEYRAKLARTDHDHTRKYGFTCCPGMLCPIYTDIATPGDTYYIQHDLDFLRTRPLLSPSMIDVLVHFESFFVPVQMVYQPMENTIFSLKNLQSSLYNLGNQLNNNLPLFDYEYYLKDICGYPTGYGRERQMSFRLADFFGQHPLAFTSFYSSGTDTWTLSNYNTMLYMPKFFPWKELVYNTIWQYYYRLDDKTQFHNWDCNWDRYYDSLNVQYDHTYEFMTIHPRPWNFDYFTSLYRSPIVSNANLQQVLPLQQYSDLMPVGGSASTGGYNDTGYNTNSNNQVVQFGSQISSTFANNSIQRAFGTALIRQMFANEKLAMITGRAKKNYDSQVLAHFGVSVPHDVKHDLTCIGHDTYRLQVGEVTSLADSGNAGLGDLAGKAWASGNGKKFKFTAPCHGFIMTLFSIEPIQRYVTGFDRDNDVVTAFDLPIPEFDRMGNVPMFGYEFGTGNTTTHPTFVTDIQGWKERYYPWKRKFNKVSEAFNCYRGSFASFGYNQMSSYMIVNNPAGVPHSRFAAPYMDERFYIPFNALDYIMTSYYVDTWMYDPSDPDAEDWFKMPYKVYQRDPFIVDTFMKVKKVSWMSKDGEPVYPY